jgi:GT2 family glycosyltransferase
MCNQKNNLDVLILIVTWNNQSTILKCLAHLKSQTYKRFEITTVDNGSTDKTLELQDECAKLQIEIIRLHKNKGFTVANNLGAQTARGKWVALLNADAFPEPDWLEKLVKAAEENLEYSFFSSRQIQYNQPELLDGTGDAYHISGLAWRNGYNYKASKYGHEQKEVFSACGAAALISRDLFLEIGGFDEDFFSYFEDVDLGFRLRLQGKKCLYVPEAVVHHVGSASTGRRSDFSVYYGYRNMIWTFFKNMPSPLIWFLLPVHIGTVLFFIFYLTLRGQGNVILRAVIDALHGLPKILKKRKDIQRNKKVGSFPLLRVMSTGLLEPYREFLQRNVKK